MHGWVFYSGEECCVKRFNRPTEAIAQRFRYSLAGWCHFDRAQLVISGSAEEEGGIKSQPEEDASMERSVAVR